MKKQSTSQILFSLAWSLPIFLLVLYTAFNVSLLLDKTFNLPIPLTSPANMFLASILVIIFFPVLVTSAYYLIRFGGGSPNPVHASPVNLVTTGPYRYIRHPMNLTYPFLVLGAASFLNSFTAIFFLTPISALVFGYHALVIQEKGLTKQFGKEYERYKKQTGAFIPKTKK